MHKIRFQRSPDFLAGFNGADICLLLRVGEEMAEKGDERRGRRWDRKRIGREGVEGMREGRVASC